MFTTRTVQEFFADGFIDVVGITAKIEKKDGSHVGLSEITRLYSGVIFTPRTPVWLWRDYEAGLERLENYSQAAR